MITPLSVSDIASFFNSFDFKNESIHIQKLVSLLGETAYCYQNIIHAGFNGETPYGFENIPNSGKNAFEDYMVFNLLPNDPTIF
ncbi:MAG: hypothetical protein NTY39_05470 [Campylobacterales bacterium]|nr:hypothetical protein [Campylobacterales bacterium]